MPIYAIMNQRFFYFLMAEIEFTDEWPGLAPNNLFGQSISLVMSHVPQKQLSSSEKFADTKNWGQTDIDCESLGVKVKQTNFHGGLV